MASTIRKLEDKGLIHPPSFLSDNTHFECIMGSVAYGVSSDTSDIDVYGWCMPPKDVLFPHLAGEIEGFGKPKKKFNQFQTHHVIDGDKEYDLSIYNIVRYFQLCMENNPNMIDSLFVPTECVLHSTAVGELVRDSRKKFLHKGCWHNFKGYAYSQLHKMGGKNPEPGSKREALRDKYGYDTKFAYHVIRLVDECEQILTLGDIDLRRSKEHMKSVRRGNSSLEEIREWFSVKEKSLEKLYEESKLPYGPNEDEIKKLLLTCLEHCYGSLDKCVVQEDAAITAIKEMNETLRRYYARV